MGEAKIRELRARNEQALVQAVKAVEVRIDELSKALASMHIALSSAINRMQEVERMVHEQLASRLGRGPTTLPTERTQTKG